MCVSDTAASGRKQSTADSRSAGYRISNTRYAWGILLAGMAAQNSFSNASSAVWSRAVILKKNYRGFISMAGGYLICLLAVLWNTETGIFLAISWAAMYVSRYFSENRVKIGKLLINIAVHVAGIVFSVLGAYGTVNLYNILKHSPVNSLEDFLVPLLSSNYMEGVLHLDMPLYPCAYMAVITLFLMGTSVGLSGWFQEEKKQCWKRELIFLLSVGALGCLVYYINRPAYHNLDCVALPAVILSAYFGQYGLRFIRKQRMEKFWENFIDACIPGRSRTDLYSRCTCHVYRHSAAVCSEQSDKRKFSRHGRF